MFRKFSSTLKKKDVRSEDNGILSEILRGPDDVRLLKNALLRGDEETHRPPLPEGVVMKILGFAEHWCCAMKTHQQSFGGYDLNYRVFRFGPVPGTPQRVTLRITSHDQGWSSYPEDQGTRNNSWTWGEVDILGPTGTSKLGERPRVFTNKHADKHWSTYSIKFERGESFMNQYEQGDMLEFYCRSMFPGWRIYVRDAQMEVEYEPAPKVWHDEGPSNA